MVARESRPTTAIRHGAEELLLAWRRTLTTAIRGAGAATTEGGQRARRAPQAVAGWTASVLGDMRSAERPVPMAAAFASLAAAALSTSAALALGTLADGTVIGAALFSAETVAWALFRLIAIAALTSRSGTSLRRQTFAACGLGVVPYVLGVTPGLRAVAFVASAVLTFRLLSRVADRSSARIAVAVAFGGQTLAALAAWAFLNGLLYLAPLRR